MYFSYETDFAKSSETQVIQSLGMLQTIVSLGSRLYSLVLANPHPELGSYIQILRILYFGGAALLIVPVYLCYDEERKLYQVRKCNFLQQIGCMVVQVVFSFSLAKRIADRVGVLFGNKGYIVNYFDVLNESVLNLYIYWHLYMHWFQTHRIEKYTALIQTTPLIRFDKTAMWKIKIFPAICWPLCVYLSLSWIRVVHRVDLENIESTLRTGENNAMDIFWFDVRTTGIAPVFALLAILSRFYNCLFHHSILNNFTPVSMLPMFFMGDDFYHAILSKDFGTEEVMMHYKEYKTLIATANDYCRVYLQYYVSMTVTFNSVHLFETLNTSDGFWKSNMLVYDFETWLILWIPTTIAIQGKGMKKWLWKNKNYMNIKNQKLSLILHDMIPKMPGKGMEAGRHLMVTSAFSGKVISMMWSYSMIAYQTSARLKAREAS